MTCGCAFCERDRRELAALEERLAVVTARFMDGRSADHWDVHREMYELQDVRGVLLRQLASHQDAVERNARYWAERHPDCGVCEEWHRDREEARIEAYGPGRPMPGLRLFDEENG